MGRYALRRVLMAIPILFAISLIVFMILALAPGDPLGELSTNPNVTREQRQQIRESMGLNDPIPVRYAKWFRSMMTGQFGTSFRSGGPVSELIMSRLPRTLWISGTAIALSILIAIPIGVLSAVKQYSVFDQVATTLAFFGFSIPTFFTGLLFILLFSVRLGWLPTGYSSVLDEQGLDFAVAMFKQSVMPITVLGLFQAATLTRFVRASTLENIHQDYVRTARAKGLGERRVVVGHVVRNALIPVVTIVALQIPAIITGAVITEQIFRVPGLGNLLIQSIQSSDTPVVMTISFLFSIGVVFMNLVADILYGVLDPRIKYT